MGPRGSSITGEVLQKLTWKRARGARMRAVRQNRSRPWPAPIHVRARFAREICSALGHDHLKILAGYDHRVVLGAVHRRDQRQHVALQAVLLGGVERGKRLEHGAVIGLEDVDEML